MYTIDTQKNEKYFIVSLNGEEILKIAKSCNTSERVINFVNNFVEKENVEVIGYAK